MPVESAFYSYNQERRQPLWDSRGGAPSFFPAGGGEGHKIRRPAGASDSRRPAARKATGPRP